MIRASLVLLGGFTVLTGLAYPLALTGIAQVVAPAAANGSLITRDGAVIGSALIGQNFASDRYFHGRPSATTAADPDDATKTVAARYNAAASTGSNLAPSSKGLVEGVAAAVDALGVKPAPADLVTASASGLDPDVSPAAALAQVPRVAKERGLDPAALKALVDKQTTGRTFGVIGEPRVNILALNMALDGLKP
jgi:K+-transporting ATPase ATPase C chain